MRISLFSLTFLFISIFCMAQAPTNLTTDLLEHTERVYLDGYLSEVQLHQLNTLIERYQVAKIRSKHPALGWIMNSNVHDTRQIAYQIVVATSEELLQMGNADMWDSGKTESDNSIAIIYNGKPLQPLKVYYWKVKTWDNHGNESPFSDIKSFMTAEKLDGRTSTYPWK